MCYGVALNIAAPLQQRYGALPVMARMLALASLWTAPYGLVGLADSWFSGSALLAVLGAGVVGTGFAYWIMGTAARCAAQGDSGSIPSVLGMVVATGGALLASSNESRRPPQSDNS